MQIRSRFSPVRFALTFWVTLRWKTQSTPTEMPYVAVSTYSLCNPKERLAFDVVNVNLKTSYDNACHLHVSMEAFHEHISPATGSKTLEENA